MASTPMSNSSLAVFSVMPNPPAAFSPLAMTRSGACRSRIRGIALASPARPGRPTTSPMKRTRTRPPDYSAASEALPGMRSWASDRLRAMTRRDLQLASDEVGETIGRVATAIWPARCDRQVQAVGIAAVGVALECVTRAAKEAGREPRTQEPVIAHENLHRLQHRRHRRDWAVVVDVRLQVPHEEGRGHADRRTPIRTGGRESPGGREIPRHPLRERAVADPVQGPQRPRVAKLGMVDVDPPDPRWGLQLGQGHDPRLLPGGPRACATDQTRFRLGERALRAPGLSSC